MNFLNWLRRRPRESTPVESDPVVPSPAYRRPWPPLPRETDNLAVLYPGTAIDWCYCTSRICVSGPGLERHHPNRIPKLPTAYSDPVLGSHPRQ